MQFLLGLFVGTFIGMVIISLCRGMAVNTGHMPCSECPDSKKNRREVAIDFS